MALVLSAWNAAADPLTGPRPTMPAAQDTAPPSFDTLNQRKNADGSFTISGHVSENRALSSVQVKEVPDGARWNGNLVGTWTSADFTVTVPPRNGKNNQVYVTVTDEIGNRTRVTMDLQGSSTPPANTAPVAQVLAPAAGSFYAAGDTLNVSIAGQDAEDGALPANSLVWWIDFHHDTHFHPARAEATGSGGSFVVPREGEVASNVWFRVHARVTDSAGLVNETYRDVLPRTSVMTLRTQPAGLALKLDAQPVADNYSATGVVGVQRQLGAVAEQTMNGRKWKFSGWSDGGAMAHTILTPSAATTYTAVFTDQGPANSNQPPLVNVTGPVHVHIGDTATLTANATDTDGSIASVSFYDGATLLGQLTAPPYAVLWTPRSQSDAGDHMITAVAVDNSGAAATSTPFMVHVEPPHDGDTTPPVVSITSPVHLGSVASGSLTLSANASDDEAVASVQFLVDGNPVATVTSAPYEASIDTSGYTAGQHVVQAQALDTAGNASPWASATVNLTGGPANPTAVVRESNWVSGLHEATSMVQLPDGRLLVAQQGGAVRVVKNGALLPAPLHTFSVYQQGESGLIGLAVDPDFASNGYVYAHYTHQLGADSFRNQIVRITVQGDVSTGAETPVFNLNPLSYVGNHNGGVMAFAPDGKLYVGVGSPSPYSGPQELTSMQGKVLRINADGSIPVDNPFYAQASGDYRAIWAIGLRNPFSLAIEPSSGVMHINDVGEQSWEEVNLGVAGANYGWAGSEGPTTLPGHTSPLFAYPHARQPSSMGGFFSGQAVTGAAFYGANGAFPEAYRSSYYFADFVQGWIARMDMQSAGENTGRTRTVSMFATGFPYSVGLLTGNDGALYVLTQSAIHRLRAAP
jgi:glucose/arabinose dehydrogenase